MKREYWFILIAVAITFPALALRLTGAHPYPLLGILFFGAAIVAAAFILSWATEVAQVDISQNLALILLALVAVLPEYVVDLYFAWTAAADPAYTTYALANMTGANRLLIGLGWPLLVFVFYFKFRKAEISLEGRRSIDIFWLGVVTLYCFLIPLKGRLDVWDAAILFFFFVCYTYHAARAGVEEPELVGPPAEIAKLPTAPRRLTTAALFIFSAGAILASAQPFAESLVGSGKIIGIDEFFLVQWLAPLATESPEIVVTLLLVLRGFPSMGLGALISAKVNQWSLLVGAVPVVYLLGHIFHHGSFVCHMDLDARQVEEIVLTAAQSLYALSVIINFRFRLSEAVILGFLFFSQLIGTMLLEEFGYHQVIAPFHYGYSALYVLLAVILLIQQRRWLTIVTRRAWRPGSASQDEPE